MTEWQLLDEHFAHCIELPLERQLDYIDSLNVPSEIDAKKIRKDLISLVQNFHRSNKDQSFLSGATKVFNQENKNSLEIERYCEICDHLVLSPLGEGFFSKVYLAENKKLARKVALKVCFDKGEEAKTLASFDHENIVRVYDEQLCKERNLRVISLQYISGPNYQKIIREMKNYPDKSLDKIIESNSTRQRPFNSWEQSRWEELKRDSKLIGNLKLIYRIARALEYAHDQGIMHLDIKPSNILVSSVGTPYLADFNISLNKSLDTDQLIGGTLRYMSPEQKSALNSENGIQEYKKLGPQSDIFSLGKVLEEVTDLLDINEDLRQIIARATNKDTHQRFSTMSEFAECLYHSLVSIEKLSKLPRLTSLEFLLFKRPLWGILALSTLPHLVVAFINIFYNNIRITPLMSEPQRAAFYNLVSIYNPLVLIGLPLLAIAFLSPARKGLNDLMTGKRQLWNQSMTELRSTLFKKVPILLGLLASVGWLGALVLFPIYISFTSEMLSTRAIVHFIIGFFLCGSIATVYSLFLYYIYSVKVLAPLFLGGVLKSSSLTLSEACHLEKSINIYHKISAVIPMLMAILILTLDPINYGHEINWEWRALSAGLIIMGIAAFLCASRFRERCVTSFQIRDILAF